MYGTGSKKHKERNREAKRHKSSGLLVLAVLDEAVGVELRCIDQVLDVRHSSREPQGKKRRSTREQEKKHKTRCTM
jgi:hypothetical protein